MSYSKRATQEAIDDIKARQAKDSPGLAGFCQHCGWPVAAEGYTLTGTDADPLCIAKPERCQGTACIVGDFY